MSTRNKKMIFRSLPQALLAGFAYFWLTGSGGAATLTMQTNVLGSTPEVLAFNSGHFLTNSNTKDWWRYAGVNGARVFLSPSNIEANDDLPPVGDGVTNQTSFLSRKIALRSNPLSPTYINWSYFNGRYETNDTYPNNHIVPNYTFREMRKLGLKICAQITASESRLVITNDSDWAGKWELWQHYYAQAFYLGREFDVERYQMFNEPNHPNAGGLTQANYLMRLQLASDAIQSALADVNALYGKSLSPKILAPVTSGSADGSYAGWGESAVTNRHLNFLGQTDTNFSLIQVYDYHQYGSSPSGFGSDLANLNGFLTADMAPEPRYPTAVSEFNTDTGASFDTQAETLDTPAKYSRFGAIAVNLLANGISELYCFKFSQTERDPPTTYPVQKNAMHYVDNASSPYNVGGITKAGEAYRLFNKAFAAGRDRLDTIKSSGASSLDVHASHDSARKRRYLYSVNNTSSGVALNLDLSAWSIPASNRVLLEEVSETSYGGAVLWTNLPAGGNINAGTQGSNSVWLLTVPTVAQLAEQIIAATDDAQVRDGANKTVNYGSGTNMSARNDPVNTANRTVALMKFQIPALNRTNIQFALLSFQAATVSTQAVVQAHVYGLDTNDWSEGSVNWSNAPNLKDDVAAGGLIKNGIVEDVGGTAHILGQLVVNSTNFSERLIDVTDFIRGGTNATVSFLVVQDPRWDVTLPSLAGGDRQPDGVNIITKEGGTGPRLRLVLRDASAPPVAVNDTASTTQNTPVVVSVLANDVVGDGGVISIVAFTQGANGSVSNNGNGTLTYSPNNGFSGIDSFGYTISDDQGGTNTASVSVSVNPPGGSPYWTNLLVSAEAFIRGGVNAPTNQDEIATGHLPVKYSANLDFSRKTYFQFDLSGLSVNVNTSATFTVTTAESRAYRVQLWGLSQSYPGFNANITWNSAQANNTNSNDLLISGPSTASSIVASYIFPAQSPRAYAFTIPNSGNFIASNRVTLAFSGLDDPTNDSGGLRLALNSAQLQVQILPPLPVNTNPPTITGIALNFNGSITMNFLGASNRIHWLQAATNLAGTTWTYISTNISDANGFWSYTSFDVTNQSQRFYRAVLP